MIKSLQRLSVLIVVCFATQLTFAQAKPDSIKKIRFAAVPLINYNRTQGVIVGAMTSAYYRVNKKDTISPHSSTTAMGIYTAEKTWLAGIGESLYLKEDKWRVKAFLFKGNVNYQYFNTEADNNAGEYEDYSNDIVMAMSQVQYNVWKRFYAGLYLEYNNTKTYFTADNDSLDIKKLNNIGYVISQDNRDNIQFPAKGIFMNFKNQFYRDWIGSDSEFVRFQINYTQFFDLKKDQRHVLLGRFNSEIGTGDVPFQGQSVVGRDDLRGYSQGKYRGNQVYSLQSEYRWMFKESKFGVVGFLGIASAVEKFNDIFSTELLPGVGAGVRYKIIPSMKINIGFDAGIGRDDYSLTFRIGEAFGR
ncbi:BamA/TamA family outer membrane protein [Flavobacterium sp. WC2509]|uniref:BamA/TamA family outer membrane protein n=1 Tax=Flavobacterium sp. WC2509 TaxID=3461406 RepID=UPI004044C59F